MLTISLNFSPFIHGQVTSYFNVNFVSLSYLTNFDWLIDSKLLPSLFLSIRDTKFRLTYSLISVLTYGSLCHSTLDSIRVAVRLSYLFSFWQQRSRTFGGYITSNTSLLSGINITRMFHTTSDHISNLSCSCRSIYRCCVIVSDHARIQTFGLFVSTFAPHPIQTGLTLMSRLLLNLR